jgi:hypothetical protein
VAKRFDAHARGRRVAFEWNGRDERRRPTEPGLHTVEILVRDDGNVATTASWNHRPVHAFVTAGGAAAGPRQLHDCRTRGGSDLDVLHAKHAGASFFCLGGAVTGHPSLARRTVAEGHTVGSHGFDHSNVASLSADEIRARVRSDVRAWWEAARVTPIPYIRPPFGLFDTEAQSVLGQEGFRYLVLWDVDPWDWSSRGATAVTRRVLSAVHRGSIGPVIDWTVARLSMTAPSPTEPGIRRSPPLRPSAWSQRADVQSTWWRRVFGLSTSRVVRHPGR